MRILAVIFFSILCSCQPHMPLIHNTLFVASTQPASRNDKAPFSQHSIQYAKPGDVATGRIIREQNNELILDTSPCTGDRLILFRMPYRKILIRKDKCGDKSYDRTQVVQQ